MTIDDAIKQLETYTIPCGKYKAAYDLAVDTMRKYQKIQEIVSSKTTRLSYEDGFRQIKEVVEDEID